jgi:hypothetical protein
VKYEQGFYIPEDGILHSYRRENLKSYMKFIFSVMTHSNAVPYMTATVITVNTERNEHDS